MRHSKALTTEDFNKTCRFCAKPNNDLKPIFKNDDFGDNNSALDGNNSIPNLFRIILNFDVAPDDRLPLFICPSCNKKLLNANSFREQCMLSYDYLIGIHESDSKANSIDVDTTKVTIAPNTVTVLIKDEQPEECSIKEETEFRLENETNFNAETTLDNSIAESAKTKYKGRGRPRKGQEVIKQKRVPKPQPLEMCQICGQLFKCIKTHMFVHDTQPQFECHHCGRKFKHKPNLICHVKNHQNVRKFKCPHCPFKFQYSTNFKRHIRTHTGEKIFSCDICQKRFSRSGGLKRHILTHDVPRVPCPYCDKMFTTKKGLVNHVGIHTGERPFKCKVCGAAFVASSSLCVHSRIHKKENPVIQCKECGLVVTDNVMLMNHMKDHQEISAVK